MHDTSVLREEDLEQSRYKVRFHMTHVRPIGIPKQGNGGYVGVLNQFYGIEPFCYAKAFLCCNEFAKLPAT